MAIRALLRPGESFTIALDSGWLVGQVTSGTELVWDNLGFDRKILLLDAYGWLWTRDQPPSTSPIWAVRSKEIARGDVARRATSHLPIPDPEDLDPTEVASVYDAHRHPHRKKP